MEQRTDLDETPDPDPDVLDAIADPYRWRAYETLRAFGSMAGWQLGRSMGVSEASCLRHLDRLHEVGFVRPVDGSATRRQQQWMAVPGGVRLVDDWMEQEEPYRSAALRWVNVAISTHAAILNDWIKWAPTWPPEWRERTEMYDYMMHLSVDDLKQLVEEVQAVYRSWWERSRLREKDGELTDTRPLYAACYIVPFPGPFG